MSLDIQGLIEGYIEEYYKQEHPFLLFDLAHVHENDHTRVLLSILKYNRNQFLPSFLNILGAPPVNNNNNIPIITDQQEAKGNKGKGYIDIYIEYETEPNVVEKIIIENKICGATDTSKQLARYIATVIGIKNDRFEEVYNAWKENKKNADYDFSHVHVVYLTSDGEKKPKEHSLPKFFRKDSGDDDWEAQHINYYPINYIDHIIPWLENDVLPKIPYADDGMMIAGIRQYICSLKKDYCKSTESNVLSNWIEEVRKNLNNDLYKLYQEIRDVRNYLDQKQSKKDESKQIALTQLSKDLYNFQKYLFKEEAPDGWSLYFTPSFILMYKESWWSELDKKAHYNFPSIHLNCSPTDNFFKTKKKLTWRIKIERLPKQGKDCYISDEKWQPIRNSIVKILDVKPNNRQFDKKEVRKNYFKEIIENETIRLIDNIIANCSSNSFQDAIIAELQNNK